MIIILSLCVFWVAICWGYLLVRLVRTQRELAELRARIYDPR